LWMRIRVVWAKDMVSPPLVLLNRFDSMV